MDMKSFSHDLAQLNAKFQSSDSQPAVRRKADPRRALTGDSLRDLGRELETITGRTQTSVKKLERDLRTKWSRSPLLVEGSLFRPLGIESKEVPMTHALAWWLGCGEIARASLAATIGLILNNKGIKASDVKDWRVSAEENPDGQRGGGRIDISLSART